MTFVVGRLVSATGRVLIGHNEDDEGHTVVRHGYVPAADWPEGTLIPAEEGMARIPQASHTFGYHWSELGGPEGGYPWGDAFFNECGVCVTSNNCAFSKEDKPDLTDGGMAYNLRRVVAERAGSAREGLMVMIDMVETWGYAPSGRCYFVADKDEAFMMQIVSGKHWMAIRIPDDHVVVMPNHYTLTRLDEYEETYCSADLVDYAFERGWYDPMKDGRFEFASVFQSEQSWRQPLSALRHKYSLEKLLGRKWDAEKEGYPASVKYDGKIGVEQIMNLLTNHFEGSEHDVRVGPGRAPHDASICRVCGADTSESFVIDFHEKPCLSTMWTAFGRPCELPYMPLHPLVGLPEELKTIPDPAQAMEDHLKPNPHLTDYKDTVWQRMHDFSQLMEMVYSECIGKVAQAKKQLFDRFEKSNAESIRRMEENYDADLLIAEDWERVRMAEAELTRIPRPWMEVLQAELPQVVRPGDHIKVVFRAAFGNDQPIVEVAKMLAGQAKPVEPVLSSLRLGNCRCREHDQYAQAISLEKRKDGYWEAVFPADPVLKWTAAGRHECFFGGKGSNGQTFAWKLMLNFIDDSIADTRYELTNEQRACFGLIPVEESWTKIDLKLSHFNEEGTRAVAYVDGTEVKKMVWVTSASYIERDMNEQLSEDFTLLLPKTAKGKPTKLSLATLDKRKPSGMTLYITENSIALYSVALGRDFYNDDAERAELKSLPEIIGWIEQWCEKTTPEDIAALNAAGKAKRKRVKYKEGDVFRFSLGRNLYGYGRILIDYVKMRKDGVPFWDVFMGTPLLVSVYHIATDRADVTVDELKNLKSLPSHAVMDNSIFYGEWEIIGNLPVGEYADYPIMYGSTIRADESPRKICLQYGRMFKTLEDADVLTEDNLERNFKFNGVGFGLHVRLDVLKKCIERGDNALYWKYGYKGWVDNDLRNPRYRDKLEAVCAQFGLNADEICPKEN